MASQTRLGGFKVLKDVVRISLVYPEHPPDGPARLFRAIAEREINLPYLTCVRTGSSWGLHLLVDVKDGERVCRVINGSFEGLNPRAAGCVILSLFPHRNNPEVVGCLFEAFGREGLMPEALAHSPSAISVVMDEGVLNRASSALFGPFTFGAYRTPEDWKLAQKGKEELYKEVVASYQEQRPKVYGLNLHDRQTLVRLPLDGRDMGPFALPFKDFARMGLALNFLTTCPCEVEGPDKLVFCLPETEGAAPGDVLDERIRGRDGLCLAPVAVFNMNGPHFGDRYGIASELLAAFENRGIDLLGLSCSIASISGVVTSDQLASAVRAIESCFEVPPVMQKP